MSSSVIVLAFVQAVKVWYEPNTTKIWQILLHLLTEICPYCLSGLFNFSNENSECTLSRKPNLIPCLPKLLTLFIV